MLSCLDLADVCVFSGTQNSRKCTVCRGENRLTIEAVVTGSPVELNSFSLLSLQELTKRSPFVPRTSCSFFFLLPNYSSSVSPTQPKEFNEPIYSLNKSQKDSSCRAAVGRSWKIYLTPRLLAYLMLTLPVQASVKILESM